MSNKTLDNIDLSLPTFSIWSIDCDSIGLDIGDSSNHPLSDQQAISALNRYRYRLKRRLEEVENELARLEDRNAPTDNPNLTEESLRLSAAKIDRYMREQYPRELEIALQELNK